jgi:hypothetical protein
MIHGDACFAYFNKIWGIPYAPGFGFTPEQIRNAIECWRVNLNEAIYAAAETAAQRYLNDQPAA